MINRNVKNTALGTVAALSVAVLATSCAASSQPDNLSDDEQQKIVKLVQDQGADISSPSCSVEVFRVEGKSTYGWASCTDSNSVAAGSGAKAEAFPFKISGNKIQKPDEGSGYRKEVHKLFPEDLWNAVDQHSQGA
ncbi:hypothetical protein [Glutamicibacter sp.]|uniref:hypothetical protein n=1 Tax=Glutamicibacter sp. TaxID=1931995 RepID=UPI0028BDC6B7|nr:hypothetical protein [Glutamicibacter sp.]